MVVMMGCRVHRFKLGHGPKLVPRKSVDLSYN